MKISPDRALEILLVEDNRGEARLVLEALAEVSLPTSLSVVSDGVEALKFLRRTGIYAAVQRPDLVLLDLNMPRKDGRAVLHEMKTDEHLQNIPVVVLSTSESEEDILNVYHLKANCYITKPVEMDKFIRVTQSIQNFWHATAHLPSKPQ
jgi:two-component system, chemotaxis family, response regulator Rcp1